MATPSENSDQSISKVCGLFFLPANCSFNEFSDALNNIDDSADSILKRIDTSQVKKADCFKMNITEEDKSFFNHNGFDKIWCFNKKTVIGYKKYRSHEAVMKLLRLTRTFIVLIQRQTQRVWNLTNKGTIFQKLLENEVLENFMEFIFDRNTQHQKYFLSFQANILHPGCNKQRLHIDTPVPEPLPDWPKGQLYLDDDDFTESNGATELCAGSHRKNSNPT